MYSLSYNFVSGLISQSLVEYTKTYLTSVVLDVDLFASLSIESVISMKQRIASTVQSVPLRCPLPSLSFFLLQAMNSVGSRFVFLSTASCAQPSVGAARATSFF